ncbi:histone-lysine N-methyltransferase PRDM9-like [Cololabis saira]|uniref:histone-lysine N-methyltransferase PRDM9-like n=1 Tax=Cololabis saira TaxID=129043 RepID=UPI002AD51C13|nr:histone-lysine N-methyltransferase PRDM9-like [Cololabis saira]
MAEKRNTPPLTLLVTARPNKKAKKRKPAEEKAAVKKALDKARGQTRVNIGPAFERWRGLKELKGFRSDAEVALFLLDSYEKDPATSTPSRPPRRPPPPPPPGSAITLETTIKSESDRYEKDPPTSTPSRPPPPPDSAIKSEPLSDRDYDFTVAGDQEVKEEETALQQLDARVPSIEIVVGIDEDNSTQNTDSDTEHSDDEMGSPAEMSVDVPEEASEENSCYDDGDDEDYEPPFSIQFDGAYKTNRCLNQVQSTSKENTTHDAAEAAEQPAEADKIQNLTESSSTVRPRKRYICHTCGREFPRNPALKRHLVIHLGERPFKCFICGRGFTQDGNLKTHMKTHKGELHKWTLVEEKKKVEEPPVTAHICGKCGMNFPEKQQLDEHRETHKKPFECLVCGKTYAQESCTSGR